jgi:hypothetical protein
MTDQISDVKPITFERFDISADGELLIFEVCDKRGNKGHIAIDWLKLGITVQLLCRAAERGADARRTLGKSDDFMPKGDLTAQLVSGFQVSEYPDKKLKILSLQSPVGFRCDFAISTEMVDQRGRSLPRAIAEELLEDRSEAQRRPH